MAPPVSRPTPAPTPTPLPEPRVDPNGVPIPSPGAPAHPDIADPAAEIADVVAVEVAMVPFVDPAPTPVGFELPTPTPTPAAPTPTPVGTDPESVPEEEPSATPTPAPGPDAPPLRVAGVVTESIGPLVVAGDVCEGARARFERANRDLELPRPIVLVDCFDDEGDPDRNRTLINQLTDDGRIFAIVPATSVALFAEDLLDQRHIPYVGVGDLPAYCGFQAGFGFAQTGALGCPALAAATTPVVAVPHIELSAMAAGLAASDLKVALVRADNIAGELLASSVALEAELLGAELVLDAAEVPTPAEAVRTGWSAVVDDVNDADADLVIIDGTRTEGLYTALRADFDGVIVGTGYTDPGAFLDDPDLTVALSGSFQISQGFDITADGPGAEQFRFDAAAIGLDADEIDRAILSGYVAADFLVAAVATTPDPITTEALHNIVNNGWQYPGIDGLVCPGWWPASHVVPYPCAAVSQVVPIGGQPLVGVVPLTSFPVVVRTPAEAAIDD